MKEKKAYAFDKQDEKAIHLFSELGIPRNLAKTLMYISQVEECRSAEIERGADLRQPEVSVAMQELQKKGWIRRRDIKKKGKGRPVHIYKLTASLNNIIKTFENEKIEEINTVKKDISELKELVESR